MGNDEAGIGIILVPASPIISGEHEVCGEVRKTPTASTANTLKCKKDLLNRLFLRVRTRSVSPAAVDKAVSARDSYEECRPHESPANGRNTSGAVAAGGILRGFLPERKFLLLRRLPAPIPESSLDAATMAFEADEQLPDEQEGLRAHYKR